MFLEDVFYVSFLRDHDRLVRMVLYDLHPKDPANFAEICHVEGEIEGFLRICDLFEAVRG